MASKSERKVPDVTATSTVVGSAIALDVAIVDGSGNQVTSFGGGGSGATIGAAVPATATAVAVKDNSGNLAYPALDASGNLLVAVTGAGSGGTSSTDGAGYTAGTTAGTPLMGARDDTGTTVLAEDKVGIARLTQYRGLHGNIRDSVGNEILQTLDYDTGVGTVTQGLVGIALPASGGPVAGGTATNPIQVSLANTAANSTAVKVDASSVAVPVTDNSGSLTVDNGGTFAVQAAQSGTWNITNVSGTVSLPTGAATVAKQPALGTAGSASTDVITVQGVTSMTPLKVDGSGVTQPVSASSLPLPTGASTAAKQPALGTAGTASSDVITIQGIASMTKLLVTPDSVALPSNQSVNVNQVAGTTTDTNSGTKSAGTLRVVLATDQPALTNKLLVTPDSVALPSNQSVNISQINSTTPLMGAGNTGTGSLRVTISTDQTQLTNALKVDPSGVTSPVSLASVPSHAVTNAGTFAVQVNPSTSGGLSVFNGTSSDGGTALTSTAQVIKASAGQVYGWYIYNPNATAQFVQFYNTAAGSVTVGTTNPLFMLTIPATSAANVNFTQGIAFSNAGFSCSATSTAGGSGAPGTALDAVVFYA